MRGLFKKVGLERNAGVLVFNLGWHRVGWPSGSAGEADGSGFSQLCETGKTKETVEGK